MKCALELQITAQAQAKKLAMQEEERKRQAKQVLRKETARFCESLGKDLEEKANHGIKPTVSFYFDTYSGVLETTWEDYSDHRMSYRSTGVHLDLQYLAEWFHQYCFNVSTTDWSGWRYNWGATHFLRVIIEPTPQCQD